MPDDGARPVSTDAAAWLGLPGAGLLLDLDGTLLDSEPVHQAAYREFFAGRGWRVDDEVVRLFSGRRGAEVFASLDGPWAGEDPDALTAGVLEVVRRSTLHAEPVAGAVELIAACSRVGLPFAMVTSARIDWALAAAALLGARDGAFPMVTAEDCLHGKPDPEPFRRGAELLGLPVGGLVAVEDSPAGITSARRAGVGHVIGVTTTQPAAVLLAAGAAETAPHLLALARLVESDTHDLRIGLGGEG